VVPAAGVRLAAILDPALADNGGYTFTHALVPGGPAVDAVRTDCGPPATDQRGVPRPQGPACDIGAVEVALCGGRVATLVGTPGDDVLLGTPGRTSSSGWPAMMSCGAEQGRCPGGRAGGRRAGWRGRHGYLSGRSGGGPGPRRHL
jgi:hypothetical protein